MTSAGFRTFYERQYDKVLRPLGGHEGRRPPVWTARSRYASAAALLPPRAHSAVDLACGQGEGTAELCRRYECVVAIDISEAVIGSARQLLATSTGQKQAEPAWIAADLNATPWPLPTASFDVVLALAIVEHVFDPYAFMAEVRRVIVPRGVLVLEVPNIAFLRHRFDLLVGRLPVTSSPEGWSAGFGWDGGHLHYFTLGTLRHLLAEAGFTVERVVCSNGRLAAIRDLWPSLLAGNVTVRARADRRR